MCLVAPRSFIESYCSHWSSSSTLICCRAELLNGHPRGARLICRIVKSFLAFFFAIQCWSSISVCYSGLCRCALSGIAVNTWRVCVSMTSNICQLRFPCHRWFIESKQFSHFFPVLPVDTLDSSSLFYANYLAHNFVTLHEIFFCSMQRRMKITAWEQIFSRSTAHFFLCFFEKKKRVSFWTFEEDPCT